MSLISVRNVMSINAINYPLTIHFTPPLSIFTFIGIFQKYPVASLREDIDFKDVFYRYNKCYLID